jgi:hypothetical protein
LKQKLWCEVSESVVQNWSELPAEQKTEKGMQILLDFAVLAVIIASKTRG